MEHGILKTFQIKNAAVNRKKTPQNTTIYLHLQENIIQKIIKKG